jgi:hypothetical protein
MRCLIAAALLVGVLVCPEKVEALQCDRPAAWWFQAADRVDAPVEKQRHDAEARATLELLERTPIIFRGRIASTRYLPKKNAPAILLVFDNVEILKGRLPRTSIDRKAFIFQELWCDGGCTSKETQRWPRDDTVVIGVRPNDFVGPSQAVKFPRFSYDGRIDAVLGMCSSGWLSPLALELLSAPDDEIARLKREYLPRRSQ